MRANYRPLLCGAVVASQVLVLVGAAVAALVDSTVLQSSALGHKVILTAAPLVLWLLGCCAVRSIKVQLSLAAVIMLVCVAGGLYVCQKDKQLTSSCTNTPCMLLRQGPKSLCLLLAIMLISCNGHAPALPTLPMMSLCLRGLRADKADTPATEPATRAHMRHRCSGSQSAVSAPAACVAACTSAKLFKPIVVKGIPGMMYQPQRKGIAINLKVQHAQPDQLRPGWLQKVNQKLMEEFQLCLIDASVRDGCIEVELDMRPTYSNASSVHVQQPNEEAVTASIARIVADLVRQEPAGQPAQDEPISKPHGRVESAAMWPVLTHLSPCAVYLPRSCHVRSMLDSLIRFTAHGANLHVPGTEIIATCEGQHIPTTVARSAHKGGMLPSAPFCTGYPDSSVTILCPMTALPRNAGMLHVVARKGKVASESCMVLLLPNADMASEVSQLPHVTESDQELQDILRDLGQWTSVVQGRLAALRGPQHSPQPPGMQRTGRSAISDRSADMADTVDLSDELSAVLVLRDVERAMVPTAVDLLHCFCHLGWAHSACSVLSDLLNADLGWSASPREMWRHLTTADAGYQALLELVQSVHPRLVPRLITVAQAAGCGTRHDTCSRQAGNYGTGPAAAAPASCSATAQPSTCAASMSVASCATSAFGNPAKKAQHRTNPNVRLQPAVSPYLRSLAATCITVLLVDVLHFFTSQTSWITLAGSAPLPLAFVVVNQISTAYRRAHASSLKAWPVLQMLVRIGACLGSAAGRPMNCDSQTMLDSPHGGAAFLACHAVVPALIDKARALLNDATWVLAAISAHVLEAHSSHSTM